MNFPALLLTVVAAAPPAPVTGLTLPPGFVAHLYADHTLANDIYTMTIDDAGRVLVAGRGYVRALPDDDGDGRADRAIDIVPGLKDGPMGLMAEGDSLYVVADGGLRRYRGYTGTGPVKGPPETLLKLRTSGEHEAHAVRRGPDGWLYLLCGNMAGVKNEWLDPVRSPVKKVVAGCLLRISPDGKSIEAVCDGFRNPYSFDFNPDGEPFTYDSDNERCVGLPWYEGCRFYHLVPGGNYGWRSPQLSQTWRKPPYFIDVVPPICDTGRGSPTGVVCYRNTHYPERYQGGFFLADWTFGRIEFVSLSPEGSSYEGENEVFLQATGENGFAPTALAVHPKTGELFVSIGGRGTRGGVYRISYRGGGAAKEIPVAKRTLDYSEQASVGWLAGANAKDPMAQRIALEFLLRHQKEFPELLADNELLRRNLASEDPLIRAATARLAVGTGKPLTTFSIHQNDVARAEVALAFVGKNPDAALDLAAMILRESRDSEAQLAAIRVVQLALGDLTAPEAGGTVWEGYTFRDPVDEKTIVRLVPLLRPLTVSSSPEVSREASRVLAAMGGVPGIPMTPFEKKPAPRAIDKYTYLALLGGLFASHPQEAFLFTIGVVHADQEYRSWYFDKYPKFVMQLQIIRRKNPSLSRTDFGLPSQLVDYIIQGFGPSPPVGDDIQRLIVQARVGEPRDWPPHWVGQALIGLDRKATEEKLSRDRFWPIRVEEITTALGRKYPFLAADLLDDSEFGRPEHLLFVNALKLDRTKAARKFLAAAKANPDYAWTPGIVALLGSLPYFESRPVALALWDRTGLEDAVLPILAAAPEPNDTKKFVIGLRSLDPDVVRISAVALRALPGQPDQADVVAAIRALRRLPDDKPTASIREACAALLRARSGKAFGPDPKAWAAWLEAAHPAVAKQLAGADGFDPVAWRRREAAIPWASGDPVAGKAVFVKATCAACHDGGGAIGPALAGVGKRFGRDDLLTAILQPSKDVSPRYRPTRITTTENKVYIGMIVYDATDGTILQTAPDTTVRIAGNQIESRRVLDTSLMPAGLLDKLTDREIADLVAYLRGLGEPPPKSP